MSRKWRDVCNELDEDCKQMARKRAARMEENDNDGKLLVGEGGDFLSEVRRYLSISKVKRVVGLGTELFGAAGPFLEKPTWWNAGKAVFGMGKVLVEDVEVWADDYFGGDEWTEPYSADFNHTLLKVLTRFPYERIKTAEEHTFVRVCNLPNGVKCGWTYTGRLQTVDHIYVETGRLEEARECIKQLLWDQFQGSSLVMRKNTRVVLSGDEARVVFEIDDAFDSKLSRRATSFADQLRRPLHENISRSIMFYGPPGTGKSTLARTIIELLGLRSFRIRIGDLGGLDNSTLFEAINIFRPDAVILDDFDRAHGQAQLLETLEFFQQRVKLVITTVNNRRMLDDALLRPGRIDMLELVEHMDEEVVKHVLGKYVDGYDLVKDWPIAFISEYVKRRTFMSIEEAAASVQELTMRVNELKGTKNENDDNDEVERMMKMLSSIKRTKKKRQPKADVPDAPPTSPDEIDKAMEEAFAEDEQRSLDEGA